MYKDELAELGLAQNESYIYITLVKHGGLGVSRIAEKSGVNRRNVYDSLNRLLEKGLVYEELSSKETLYFPVDPAKLREIVAQKSQKLESVLPSLIKMFGAKQENDAVYMYKGIEGWKNYLRDMARVGGTVRVYGAMGASLDERSNTYFEQIKSKLAAKKAEIKVLYREEALKGGVVGHFGKSAQNKILAKGLGTHSSFGVFGDMTYVVTDTPTAKELDDEVKMVVIKNKQCAQMFEELFELAWNKAKEA